MESPYRESGERDESYPAEEHALDEAAAPLIDAWWKIMMFSARDGLR